MIDEELANNRYVNEMTLEDVQVLLNTIQKLQNETGKQFKMYCTSKTIKEISRYADINSKLTHIVSDSEILLMPEPNLPLKIVYKPEFGKVYNVIDI